ncbi:MAG: hypothetical protein GC145_08565 [Caulobacter sp.]|nr:hypothetical protein [Caulobacter sp.]
MAGFSATVQLSDLDGITGFTINGVVAGQRLGFSVSSAGDINGDGIDDLIIAAPATRVNGMDYAGASYVVFGKAGGLGASFDLNTLDGANGFRLEGAAAYEQSNKSVATAGDVNGDGYDDLIVGSPYGAGSEGGAYIIFGKATAFLPTFALSSLDGTDGFQVNGVSASSRAGWSVSSAGDVNGDGFGDVIIAGRDVHIGGITYAGAAYVVFGKASGFAAQTDLGDLDGTNGFRLAGVAQDDRVWAVASAGDVNGDGMVDLMIGAPQSDANGANAGSVYIVFGRAGPYDASIDLAGLDGATGFRITGAAADDRVGKAIASAGDLNGDGFEDIVIGSYAAPNSSGAGRVYVVFGKAGGFDASFDLANLDGSNGFRLDGPTSSFSGAAVASAGDLNGDGLDDLLIGAWQLSAAGASAGGGYVVFGKTLGFAATLSLAALDGTDGFNFNGVSGSRTGLSVASAGDVNGDGLVDIIVGGYMAGGAGAAYVIYGKASAPAPIILTGTAGADSYTGGGLDDQLSGLAGADTLSGLGGDDILDGGDDNDLLYGGDGTDQLFGGMGGDTLYGDAGDDVLGGGDGGDKLYGGSGGDQLNGGTGNDVMYGELEVDTLNGGAGNDYLDGGLGADIMSGGTGNDVYIVDNIGDQTIELPGEGSDIVRTTLTWTLSENIETLQLQGATNADGTGNAGANNLQGNVGNNTLSGLAGVDTINGNDGDDIIIGGEGNDLLRGGSGADTFVIAHAFSGAIETDQIYDFNTAEGDIIDLSGAFAGTIVQVAAFTHQAGEMTLTYSGGVTILKLDIDGNGVAEYQMKINGDVTADTAGWLL